MSWLKLTAGYLYLMKGGADQYIDRVKIDLTSSTNEKIEGSIAEFPHEWFESEIQRPKTIVVSLDEVINKLSATRQRRGARGGICVPPGLCQD